MYTTYNFKTNKKTKNIFVFLFALFITKSYAQTFDTLNFIDNFSNYIAFLDTAKTSKICKAFKNSKYYSHSADRKPYPEYILNNDYYNKYKITEVDFVTFGSLYPNKDYLLMFAFYSPVSDSTYISNKLTSNGWTKEKFSNDLNALFRKTINEKNYFIDCQKFPDRETFRYYITTHEDE